MEDTFTEMDNDKAATQNGGSLNTRHKVKVCVDPYTST